MNSIEVTVEGGGLPREVVDVVACVNNYLSHALEDHV